MDDEPVVLDVLRNLLDKEGYAVDAAADAATGRALLEGEGSWDAVLLDLMLPDATACRCCAGSASASPSWRWS